MTHHKRRRPRNRRGGCKLCQPWKINGFRTERAGGAPSPPSKSAPRAEAAPSLLQQASFTSAEIHFRRTRRAAKHG
jgi:hypothetical protein